MSVQYVVWARIRVPFHEDVDGCRRGGKEVTASPCGYPAVDHRDQREGVQRDLTGRESVVDRCRCGGVDRSRMGQLESHHRLRWSVHHHQCQGRTRVSRRIGRRDLGDGWTRVVRGVGCSD